MRLLYITIYLCLWYQNSSCQAVPDRYFHHIKVENGLSYGIINCFLKDSRGLLWIGTYNGLNRYDGAHFKVFKKDSSSYSLPDNTVHDLAEDHQGNIWGATEAGLFKLSRKNQQFTRYRIAPSRQYVWNILVDKHGTIWASHGYGLVRYHAGADSFLPAPLNQEAAHMFPRMLINKNGLAAAPDGSGLWAASIHGLFFYDPATGSLTSGKNHTDTLLYNKGNASALCATPFGHFWYYDNKTQALVQFDPVKRKMLQRIQPDAFAQLGGVTTLFEDNNQLLWVSTWNYEMFSFDYLHGSKAERIQHNKDNRQSVAGDFFWAAMHEPDGTLWLGTVGGISRHNTNRALYKLHRIPDTLLTAGASITFLNEQQHDASWWIGTSNSLLLQYHPQSKTCQRFRLTDFAKNKLGYRPLGVSGIWQSEEKVYMASPQGLWVRQYRQGRFVPCHIAGIPDTVAITSITSMSDSTAWLVGHSSFWYFNTRTNLAQQAYLAPGSLAKNAPFAEVISKGRKDTLWMLLGDDLFGYIHPGGGVTLPAQAITSTGAIGYYTSMIADSKGRLWAVRKGEGLYSFYPATKAYRLYAQYHGLVMDHIIDATEDSLGRIWTAAYNQISVLSPESGSFYNFTLPLNENRYGYTNVMTTLRNGHVVSSVADKLVEFFPDRLKPYIVRSKPLISALYADGKEIPIPDNTTVKLQPHQNSLVFHFGLIADQEDVPFVLEYMLEGSTSRWTVAESNAEAVYNQLAPGKYTFRVRAAARDKSWTTKEAILNIHLAAPFYRTVWFGLLMAAALLAILYGVYYYRLRQQRQVLTLQNKAQRLEKEKTLVMFENLKQQLNPHFLFNSLMSLSGLIEADQQMAGTFLNQMSGIYRYILMHAESEKVLLKEELEFVQLYIDLQATRFADGLQVRMRIPDEYRYYKIAPVTLQNLIDNAIKHNIVDAGSPLIIEVYIVDDYLVVKNNLQRKRIVETSNKIGLVQFVSLYAYLSAKPVYIEETANQFIVRVPLL
jgi:ligand-binding sensor domain-containing protein